jgi:hypothetical protein
MLIFILVFINSIKLHAQLSPNVLRGINLVKGTEYNINLVLQNEFKLNKLLSRSDYKIYEKKAERFEKPEMVWYTSNEKVKISQSEIEYKTEVELDEIEDYIKELNYSYSPRNCRSKVYKKSGKNNTMYTYLINNKLLLTISGYSSASKKTKGTVYYSISKI